MSVQRKWPASPCEIHVTLDACPLCGSDADCWNYIVEAAIQCVSCGLTITRRHKPGNDDSGVDAAIAAWNTRPTAQAVAVDDASVRRLASHLKGKLFYGTLNDEAREERARELLQAAMGGD